MPHVLPLVLALGAIGLAPSTTVQRTIGTTRPETFQVVVSANRFVRLVVEQGETDLKVVVFGPDGSTVAEFDAWDRGREHVFFVSKMPGVHVVSVAPVRPLQEKASYRVRFESERDPSPEDEAWVEARRLGEEARRLSRPVASRSELEDALGWRRRALALWRDLKDSDCELATLVTVGILQNRLNEYDEADAMFREALLRSQELNDRRTAVGVLNNLAANAWAVGRASEATALFTRAIDIWVELAIPNGEATTRQNLGVLQFQAGNFDEARQQYARAVRIFHARGEGRTEGLTRVNMASTLETLGERGRALEELARAIPLLRASQDRLNQGRAYLNRARIHLALQDLPRARAALATARPLVDSDRLAVADAHALAGRILASAGERAGALVEFETALGFYRGVGSRRGESDAFHDIGVARLALGDTDRATESLARAYELREASGLESLKAETLMYQARAARLSGQLERAHTLASAAIDLADRMRSRLFERELRTSYTGAIQRYYAEDVEALLALHRQRPGDGFAAQALDVAERARARGQMESLRESVEAEAAPRPHDPLAARERQLREQMSYWSWRVSQLADQPESDAGTNALAMRDRAIDEHAAAEAEMLRADPAFAAAMQLPLVPLAAVQRELLDDRTMLLEYALGDERSYAWVVTRATVDVVELPARAEIERRVRGYYDLVSGDPALGGRLPDHAGRRQQAAAALGEALLAPLSKLEAGARVLIAADGALNTIPFAALPIPGRRTLLGTAHDLVMIPSSSMATLLARDRARRAPASKVLAVLADPVFHQADARVARHAPRSGPLSRLFSRLPFSRDEAEGILRLVAPGMRLGLFNFAANRDAVTANRLADYRYVHFATHAVRDDAHPGLSGIVLSLVDRDGTPRNGFIRLQELFALRLNADLVVLSACESGAGKPVGGEGLLSLARGFFAAGASSVLAALWDVDDEATAAMMQHFYKALLGGVSKAAALRTAQLAMRSSSRWSDPFYWSGFVLQGAA